MKHLVIVILCLSIISTIQSQTVYETYEGTEAKHYYGVNVIETSDDNFLIASIIYKPNTTIGEGGFEGLFLAKVNSQGDTIWQSQMFTNDSISFDIKRTFENSDGSFAVLAYTSNESFTCSGTSYDGSSVRMIKFGANGNFNWQKTILGNCSHSYGNIAQLSSGDFLVASKYGDLNSSNNIKIAVVDTSGNLVYENINNFPSTINYFPRKLLKKDNNTYYLLTRTAFDVNIVEVDVATGTINYTNTPIFNAVLNLDVIDAIELDYGNYLILINNNLNPQTYWSLIKMNNAGNIIWEKILDNRNYQLGANLAEDAHGRTYLGYHEFDTINQHEDFKALIFDKHGNPLYTKRITTVGESEYSREIIFDSNTDELVIIGSALSSGDTLGHVFFMKDTVSVIVSNHNYTHSNHVKMFPNPSNGILQLECENCEFPLSINIYDALGKVVYTNEFSSSMNTLNLEHLNDGVYFYKIADDNRHFSTGKILIQIE